MANTTTYYHGGPEAVTEIRVGGHANLFDGVFATDNRELCLGFGNIVTEVELGDEEIACKGDFCETREEYIIAENAVRAMGYGDYSDEQIAELTVAALNDRETCGLERGDGEGEGYQSWELQRIRGRIAAAFGFRAVEMRDETGISLLIVRL